MKFIKANGHIFECDTFMRGPSLDKGTVWNRDHNQSVWREVISPHAPDSDPSSHLHDLHIFGYHHQTFLRKQYQ